MQQRIVIHHHECIRIQEMEEALLHALFGSKFRNDFDGITLILRKLVFDVEGADGINLITEEIDTERIFATVGIDV